jgi:peptidoglycan/LPS O-acetylase OafA/YrhL
MANVDRLRILAAIGVASFHTHPAFPRCIGVISFIILMLSFGAFVANRQHKYDIGDLARRKTRRLLKPWLFWSAVYAAVGLIKVFIEDVSFSEVFSPSMLLTGTRIHLWFLPFAFIAALILAQVHNATTKQNELPKIYLGIAVGILCLLICSAVLRYADPGAPIRQWMLGIPAVPLGFALGRTLILSDPRQRRNIYVLVSVLIAAAGAALAWQGISRRLALSHCVAIPIVCASLYWPGDLDSVSRRLAALSYGIYLSHPLVVTMLAKCGLDNSQSPALLLLAVVSVSTIITLFLKRTPANEFV